MIAELEGNLTKQKTILVVEDDRDINELIRSILGDDGYRTEWAVTGDAAAEIIRKSEPDMIILDIMLPDCDGLQLMKKKELREVMSRVPTLVLSARSDLDTKIAAFSGGARRYLTKPFTVEDLRREVKAIFRQREISEQVSEYREACEPEGDFGAFPSDVKKETEACMEDQHKEK